MSEPIQEYVDSQGVVMRVDQGQGILRGVKVLGLESRNGRTYLAEALEKAVSLYEGAKVNVNHPKTNPLGPRDYQDRLGNLHNVALRADEGLFADLHFNPKHALAEQLVWDAEHAPQNVGFSHNVLARTSRQGKQTVVEAITRVQSVDLVADPATTDGLFESVDEDDEQVSSDITDAAELEPTDEALSTATETPVAEQADTLESLRSELDQVRTELADAQRRVLIHRLLNEAGFPGTSQGTNQDTTVITERFVKTLMRAPDETTVEELIRDRAELIESLRRDTTSADRPRSRDQSTLAGHHSPDAKSFAKAIT